MPEVCLNITGLVWVWQGPQGGAANWTGQLGPGLTVLVGGDGTGKSTRLRLLAAAQSPQAGQLALHWGAVDSVQRVACAAWPDPVPYQRHVFWCDPANGDHGGLAAAAYVDHHRQRQALWQEPLFQALLADLQLQGHLHKPLLGLSMGMRRKLRLACAVASGAALTLMDDPLAALDQRSIGIVSDLLADCAHSTRRVFVSTAYEMPEADVGAQVVGC